MPVRFEDEVGDRRHRHRRRRHSSEDMTWSSPAKREPDIQHKKKCHTPEHTVAAEPVLQRKKRSKSSSPSRVEREPALQRKHRTQTSSTKSQIFFPANTTTSTSKPATTASSATSLSTVPPTPSASVSTVPAGISSGARSHDHHSGSNNNNSNEYILLGDQSKFASNVVYHVRPRTSNMFRRAADTQKTSSKRLSAPAQKDKSAAQPEKQRRESRRRFVDGRNQHSSVELRHSKSAQTVAHGSVDDSEVCPTPDAPRSQTKAPRLETHRPAPRVIVDTGRPVKNKRSQDQQELPDKSRFRDQGPELKPSLSKDRLLVPFHTKSGTTVQKDHGPLASQAPVKPSRSKTEQVPSPFKTSELQDQNPVAAQSHFNISEPKDDWELKSQAVQFPTKPSVPQNTQLKPSRLEDTGSPQTEIRPQVSQHHGRLQTETKTSRTKLVENNVAHDGDKNKKKTTFERVHHRDLREDKDNMKRRSNEKNENQPTSTNEAAVAAAASDPDYAVKYRLGLVPRRSSEPKRKSEYQREFQWRAFERNSPLMTAAQVYKSCPDLSQLTGTTAPIVNPDTEYRAAYKQSTSDPEHFNANNSTLTADAAASHSDDDDDDDDGINEVERSSSVRDENDNVSQPNNNSRTRHRSHSAQGRPARNVSVAANWGNFYPASARVYKSEYASRYLEPWKLLPRHGVTAAAAHNAATAADDDKVHHGNHHHDDEMSQGVGIEEWYSQVQQLRRDAEDYKQRGQRTHFSREHLAQLTARNAQLWDIVSNHSENLSPRVSQDELDVGEQQQPASSRDDDDDDDDDAGSVDQPQHQTEVRRDENAHHHPGRRHRGDRLPAAESNTRCRDVAIQVDDVTRQSSSSQSVSGDVVRRNRNRKSTAALGNPTAGTQQKRRVLSDTSNTGNTGGYHDNETSRDSASVSSSCSLASEVLERARRRQMQLNWT